MISKCLLPKVTSEKAEALRLQQIASDPALSVWVAAAAGSGKTKTLTDRVLRLLLSGVSPERILCLTFTKSAAAEMQNRVSKHLAGWAVADDCRLKFDLNNLTGTQAREPLVEHARGLFTTVLDAPDGLQFQTIHSFCQSVLRKFPLEAGVMPQFQVLDERKSEDHIRSALKSMTFGASKTAGTHLSKALITVSSTITESGLFDLIKTLFSERFRFLKSIDEAGGLVELGRVIRQHLELDLGITNSELFENSFAENAFNVSGIKTCISAMKIGNKRDKANAKVLDNWIKNKKSRMKDYPAFRSVFLTKNGALRARLTTKSVVKSNPEVDRVLKYEGERLIIFENKRRALRIADRTLAIVEIAYSVLQLYESEKHFNGLLDYDDLILKTLDLFSRPGIASWALFKLDGGLDHILIDEAQDTNDEQWYIIEKLTEEFFTHLECEENSLIPTRTIFAVGDIKQSIFSFQRADPQSFLNMREKFSSRVKSSKRGWQGVSLNVSFRSTSAVLTAVDAVFNARSGEVYNGVGVLERGQDKTLIPIFHKVHRKGDGGRAELWPMEISDQGYANESWSLPIVQLEHDQPQRRLANKIGDKISQWLKNGEILESKGRLIRPSDIMILVRRREPFMHEMVKALKDRRIEVTGIDRVRLTDQLAVMDLVAFGHFLLLPHDDLNLATVLKGPLVGLSEEDLLFLCMNRERPRLWDELNARAQQDNHLSKVYRELNNWLKIAQRIQPYELYSQLLSTGGRRQILERLGPDVGDSIDEFLNQMLEYQSTSIPSLQGFLHWMSAAEFESKRDLETAQSDQVRILTVHAAKGLQAPIVFLPDTSPAPNGNSNVLWSKKEGLVDVPLWSVGSNSDDSVAHSIRLEEAEKLHQEYRRLLYVAMTRAEDRLYISGWGSRKDNSATTWYQMVKAGFETIAERQGDSLVIESKQLNPVESETSKSMTGLQKLRDLPPWANSIPAKTTNYLETVYPSGITENNTARSPFHNYNTKHLKIGNIIHYLLQWLSILPTALREEAANEFLGRPVHGLNDAERQYCSEKTLSLLSNQKFRDVFSDQAVTEVPIVGTVYYNKKKLSIAGRVDRMLITSEEVWVIDFKTSQTVPTELREIPTTYFEQMAAYRILLKAIYPKHCVRCSLLWVDMPILIDLPKRSLENTGFSLKIH